MLRIAAVPEAHPYVQHIRDRHPSTTVYLPESFRAPGRWWPPMKFTPGWVRAHADELDVLHVHFGLESYSVEHVREVATLLRGHRIALVVSVHDLQHPHLTDDSHHLAQLDALLPLADEVITLTPGAARAISRRWSVAPTVIEHPHVVPLGGIARTAPGGERIAVHLKDLRPAVDVRPIAGALARLAGDYPVELHLQDPAREEPLRDQAAAIEAVVRGGGMLVRHARPDDAELHAQVRRSRVQVLPYVRGTHSGWLEMCLDLGVAVAVPRVGYLAEQCTDPRRVAVYDVAQPGSLDRAVRTLLAAQVDQPGWAAGRQARHGAIVRAHEEVYRRAVAAARAR